VSLGPAVRGEVANRLGRGLAEGVERLVVVPGNQEVGPLTELVDDRRFERAEVLVLIHDDERKARDVVRVVMLVEIHAKRQVRESRRVVVRPEVKHAVGDAAVKVELLDVAFYPGLAPAERQSTSALCDLLDAECMKVPHLDGDKWRVDLEVRRQPTGRVDLHLALCETVECVSIRVGVQGLPEIVSEET
jgi:hypothetical protein